YNRRSRATLRRQSQVALQAARIEIAIQPTDQKHEIDIRRDWLLVFATSGGAAREECRARQYSFHDRLAITHNPRGDPISHYRHICACWRAMPKRAAGFGRKLQGFRVQTILVAVRDDYARKHESARGIRIKVDRHFDCSLQKGQGTRQAFWPAPRLG